VKSAVALVEEGRGGGGRKPKKICPKESKEIERLEGTGGGGMRKPLRREKREKDARS